MIQKTEKPKKDVPHYLYLSNAGTRISTTKKAKKGEKLNKEFSSLQLYINYLHGS